MCFKQDLQLKLALSGTAVTFIKAGQTANSSLELLLNIAEEHVRYIKFKAHPEGMNY